MKYRNIYELLRNPKPQILNEYLIKKKSRAIHSIFFVLFLFLAYFAFLQSDYKIINNVFPEYKKADSLLKSDTSKIASEYFVMNLDIRDRYGQVIIDARERLIYKFIGITLFVILLFYLVFLFEYKRIYFHCPMCSEVIYVSQIKKLNCPTCHIPNINFFKLIEGRCKCETKLKYIECPHCHGDINLFNKYDHEKIKQKIYSS